MENVSHNSIFMKKIIIENRNLSDEWTLSQYGMYNGTSADTIFFVRKKGVHSITVHKF